MCTTSRMQGSFGGWRWRLRGHLSKELKPRTRHRGDQNLWRGDGQTLKHNVISTKKEKSQVLSEPIERLCEEGQGKPPGGDGV